MRSHIIDRISFLSLFAVVTLLPVFFLPFTSVSIETSKGLFLVIGLIVAVICWIVARFSDGKVVLPKSLCLLAGGGGIVVATFLSALFSGSTGVSLFGTMLDVGTFWFIFCAVLLMLISSIVFRDPKSSRLLLFGVMASSILVLVFQTLHIFLPKVFALGVLVGKTDTIVGSWNAFGIFAGLFVIAALFISEFFPVTKQIKVTLGFFTVLALFLIAVVNFGLIWKLVGIFALLVFIYKISISSIKDKEAGKIDFPVFSFVVMIVALFFFMSAGLLGGALPTKLGISSNEVNPSFTSTVSVTKGVLRQHPVFGIGPNRFSEAWALYKPALINGTVFWDVSFNSGSGILTTLTATTGIVGILAWLAFFTLFIIAGFKSLFSGFKSNILHMEAVLFFFMSLYLFVAAFFYFTGTTLFLLALIFAGIFIGLVTFNKPKGELVFEFFSDHRKSFFFMFFLIILMIVSAAVGFKYVQRFVSVRYFTKTVQATKIEDAQNYIAQALRLNTNDLYLRTYSQVYLIKLNNLVTSQSSQLTEVQKADLQTSLDQAINGAQAAINYNPKNSLNYEMLGSVFQTAGLIGTKDAYDRAIEAYKKAAELNPRNPRLQLTLAGIYFAENKSKDAKQFANTALTIKPDYVDALITLSRIAKSEGSNGDALAYAQRALAILPGNQDLQKYVDSLKAGAAPAPAPTVPTTADKTPKN